MSYDVCGLQVKDTLVAIMSNNERVSITREDSFYLTGGQFGVIVANSNCSFLTFVLS